MLNSFSSNAILTKVHAIFGKRLTPSDFSQMTRKSDVGEVAAFLKENPSYQKALKNINETEIHRGQLESLIKKDLYLSLIHISRGGVHGNGYVYALPGRRCRYRILPNVRGSFCGWLLSYQSTFLSGCFAWVSDDARFQMDKVNWSSFPLQKLPPSFLRQRHKTSCLKATFQRIFLSILQVVPINGKSWFR